MLPKRISGIPERELLLVLVLVSEKRKRGACLGCIMHLKIFLSEGKEDGRRSKLRPCLIACGFFALVPAAHWSAEKTPASDTKLGDPFW